MARLTQDTIRCGRLGIHHTYGGNGSPVLFVHGLGSSGYIEWRFNLERVAARHAVYAPDLPGFGRSDKPAAARYGVAFFARTVVRYMQEVGLRSAAVVGASLGGRVALELTLKHPRRVTKLALVNALGLGRPKIQPHYPLAALPGVGELGMRAARRGLAVAPAAVIRRVAARLANVDTELDRLMDDTYVEHLKEMYAAEGYPEAYLATVRSLITLETILGAHDLTRQLHRIHVPVLLVWGANDQLFPVEHATRAHRELDDSRLVVVEGAGHTPQAERPDQFNRALLAFLAR